MNKRKIYRCADCGDELTEDESVAMGMTIGDPTNKQDHYCGKCFIKKTDTQRF